MSQENVVDADALATAITEALNARDADALAALGDPDFEFHSGQGAVRSRSRNRLGKRFPAVLSSLYPGTPRLVRGVSR